MPRPSRIQHPDLALLERELRLVPREALLRDVERIEALALIVEPHRSYPLEWVVARITGYRPSAAGAGQGLDGSLAVIDGAALLADLSPMCEQLCARIDVTVQELERERFVSLAQLRREWRISASTAKRLKARGLVCRWARGTRRVPCAMVSLQVAGHVSRTCADMLGRAKDRSRIDARDAARMVRRAQRYRRVLGWGPTRIAQRLAERFGRSVEGVRRLLARDPRTRRAFGVTPRTGPSRRLAMARLHRMGTTHGELAQHLKKPARLVRRDVALAWTALLHEWLREGWILDQDWAGISPLALDTPPARCGLGRPWLEGDPSISQIAQQWRARGPEGHVEERDRAAAFRSLAARAGTIARSLRPVRPEAAALDECVTALRWSGLLLRDMVRSQHRLVIDTIEARTMRALHEAPPDLALRLLRTGVRAAAVACHHFDPLKPGRLAAGVGLNVDRAISRELARHARATGEPGDPRSALSDVPQRRASVLHASELTAAQAACALRLPRGLLAWCAWVEAPWFVERSIAEGWLDEDSTRTLCLRWGLGDRSSSGGPPPCTLSRLGEILGTTRHGASLRESAALRTARVCYAGQRHAP